MRAGAGGSGSGLGGAALLGSGRLGGRVFGRDRELLLSGGIFNCLVSCLLAFTFDGLEAADVQLLNNQLLAGCLEAEGLQEQISAEQDFSILAND